MKSGLKNLLLLLITLLIGLGICEGIARLITSTNEDGQAYYGKRPLLPYRFPAEMVRRKMDFYFSRQTEAYVVDHPLLGWTIGPHRSNVEGMYRANSAGIRSRPNEYPLQPPEGVLRIALFGDSFTHGDEEPFNATWGKFLEDDLHAAGISAEVLNFGVPGYGVGQAYLRWLHQGREYSPRIAVFGFQPENIQRSVNIFRSLYSRDTGLVFSKPRFVINSAGELDLLNSPVIPPAEVADTLKNLARSPLADYEYWYIPDNYRETFWLKSRLVAFLYTIFNEYRPKPGGRSDFRPGLHYWDPEGEPMQTSLLILKKFVRDSRTAGEIPIVLHIPKKNDLKYLEGGSVPAHYRILEELEREGVLVVDPAPEMTGQSRLYKNSHYSRRGGKIVARVLAAAIIRWLEENQLRESFRGEVPSRRRPDPEEFLLEEHSGGEDLRIDLGTADDRWFIEEGFFHRENHHGQTPVRWTGQTAGLRIPVAPRGEGGATLTFRIADTGPAREEIGSAAVEIRGRTIARTRLEAGEKIYRLELPAGEIGGEPTIARLFLLSPPWQPSVEMGVADSRELGVMLDWVELRYR